MSSEAEAYWYYMVEAQPVRHTSIEDLLLEAMEEEEEVNAGTPAVPADSDPVQ